MSDTAVTHRLVAGYLRQFDAAASVLPVPRARELREQVVAHIDEALSPDAGQEEVAAVLRGLAPRICWSPRRWRPPAGGRRRPGPAGRAGP